MEFFRQANSGYKWLPIAVLLVLLLDAAGDDLLYYRVNQGNRGEWRKVFSMVENRIQEGDQVVSAWPDFSPYYMDREILQYVNVNADTVQNSGDNF
jgi:hypothetical protein